MKRCNTEIMKMLRKIQEDKSLLLRFEALNSVVKYSDQEEPIESDYDYHSIRQAVDKLNDEERRLKGILAYSNATTKVDGYDFSISEALVYLTQLSNKKNHLSSMALIKPLDRSIVYNKIEYKKALFDPNEVDLEVKRLTDEIAMLQMAIDRTNLTNLIDC